MKIITVNLPEEYIRAIDQIVGMDGLYPSRSELIRVAVRQFLLQEISSAKQFQDYFKNKGPHIIKNPNSSISQTLPIKEDPDAFLREYKSCQTLIQSFPESTHLEIELAKKKKWKPVKKYSAYDSDLPACFKIQKNLEIVRFMDLDYLISRQILNNKIIYNVCVNVSNEA